MIHLLPLRLELKKVKLRSKLNCLNCARSFATNKETRRFVLFVEGRRGLLFRYIEFRVHYIPFSKRGSVRIRSLTMRVVTGTQLLPGSMALEPCSSLANELQLFSFNEDDRERERDYCNLIHKPIQPLARG